MWLLFAFLIIPLIEIALFIQIGGAIGLGWTLLIVVLTAILGATMVRRQGVSQLHRLQTSFSQMRDPTEPLAHGAMILFAGALLLTPGFFTDAVGFSLLIPNIRKAVFAALIRHANVRVFQADQNRPQSAQRSDIIDGDFQEVHPGKNASNAPSGWTKD